MVAITVCSGFGAQEKKICYSISSPFICPEVMGPDDMTLVFWMFSFLSQLLHAPLLPFSSFLLSAIRVVSSAYLKLLIFLLAILIPACDSSSLTFHVMYSPYKLNKQTDNIQPCHTPFPILNQSIVPRLGLIIVSCPAYRFLWRQVRWSGIPISFRIFHSLLWSTQSEALAWASP